MFEWKFAVDEDRAYCIATIGELQLKLDAAQLDRTLQGLAVARAQMLPVVRDAPSPSPWQIEEAPQFGVAPDRLRGGAMLAVRHSGYGWVTAHLPNNDVVQLISMLQRALA